MKGHLLGKMKTLAAGRTRGISLALISKASPQQAGAQERLCADFTRLSPSSDRRPTPGLVGLTWLSPVRPTPLYILRTIDIYAALCYSLASGIKFNRKEKAY